MRAFIKFINDIQLQNLFNILINFISELLKYVGMGWNHSKNTRNTMVRRWSFALVSHHRSGDYISDNRLTTVATLELSREKYAFHGGNTNRFPHNPFKTKRRNELGLIKSWTVGKIILSLSASALKREHPRNAYK